MTKILYWNIENFAQNKIDDVKRRKGRASNWGFLRSVDRKDYILKHLSVLDPDIFIIVEIETPWADNRGTLCGGDGEQGVNILYQTLFRKSNTWALVPPLVTGNKEAVAVFFRDNRVQFSGPKLWAGGNGPTNDQVTAGTAQDYSGADWETLASTAVNGNSHFNPNVPQNNCAGAVEFEDGTNTLVDFGDTRSPFQTTFWDINGQRNLNIFTLHSPANHVGASDFLNTLATLPDITGPLVNDEVRMVLGDFNLNLLRVADNTYTDPYTALVNNNFNYQAALVPPGAVPNPLWGYRGYFATHIRRGKTALFWSTQAATVYYPGYAYTGSPPKPGKNPGRNESIDNVLFKGNRPQPLVPRITIINGVVGSPFNNAQANPGGAPQGTAAFTAEIDWQDFAVQPNPGKAPNIGPLVGQPRRNLWPGAQKWFRNWDQFGKIRSTSDHLALLFEI
jgi:hypothetical protein